MDSHHDQVMRARARLAGASPRRYFGYGTVLDRAAFDEWRTQHGYDFFALPAGRIAEALDVELIYDFPSRWWGGRVAGIADAAGASVWGLVYEIPGEDWPIIAHKEGAITNMCVERRVIVRVGDERLEATAFTTRPERRRLDGPVSARFVEALTRGAREAGLPSDWVARLERGG